MCEKMKVKALTQMDLMMKRSLLNVTKGTAIQLKDIAVKVRVPFR